LRLEYSQIEKLVSDRADSTIDKGEWEQKQSKQLHGTKMYWEQIALFPMK